MAITLKPCPGSYAKLAAQWEAKEVQRQHASDSAVRKYMISERNHFFILFVVAILLMQLSLFLHKMYISRRRQTRRQLYASDGVGTDVEDVITVSWVEDEKLAIVLDDDSNK